MKTVYTADGTMTVTRDNGTTVTVSPTPSGIIVRDAETGASTLHTGISRKEADAIIREVLESCQKEQRK